MNGELKGARESVVCAASTQAGTGSTGYYSPEENLLSTIDESQRRDRGTHRHPAVPLISLPYHELWESGQMETRRSGWTVTLMQFEAATRSPSDKEHLRSQ